MHVESVVDLDGAAGRHGDLLATGVFRGPGAAGGVAEAPATGFGRVRDDGGDQLVVVGADAEVVGAQLGHGAHRNLAPAGLDDAHEREVEVRAAAVLEEGDLALARPPQGVHVVEVRDDVLGADDAPRDGIAELADVGGDGVAVVAEHAGAQEGGVAQIDLRGVIDQVNAAYIEEALTVAADDGYDAALLVINSPGGELTSMQRIIEAGRM